MSKKNKRVVNTQPVAKPVTSEGSAGCDSYYTTGVNWGAIPMILLMKGGIFFWTILPAIQYVVGAIGFCCSVLWLANTAWYPYHWCWYSLYLVASTVVMVEAWIRQNNRLNGKHSFGSF